MVKSLDRDDDIQIADFGLSKFATPTEVMNLPCGTLAYVAPEVLKMEGYGREVDIWSIGVIMYVLLRGRLPFEGKKKSQIVSKTLSGKLFFDGDPVWEKISSEAKELIRALLQVDPERRISIDEALKHSWLYMEPNSSRDSSERRSSSPIPTVKASHVRFEDSGNESKSDDKDGSLEVKLKKKGIRRDIVLEETESQVKSELAPSLTDQEAKAIAAAQAADEEDDLKAKEDEKNTSSKEKCSERDPQKDFLQILESGSRRLRATTSG
jgi:serine/threonine protein kinase